MHALDPERLKCALVAHLVSLALLHHTRNTELTHYSIFTYLQNSYYTSF